MGRAATGSGVALPFCVSDRYDRLRHSAWSFRTRGVLPLLLSALHTGVLAQDASSAGSPCDGRIVSGITITPRNPSFLSFPSGLRALARGVGLHHTTSKADAIASFLLLRIGEPCTERQRAETERILRLQPFLADATVRAVEDTRGSVRIEVETIDEIPTVFRLGLHDMLPSSLRFGNGNVGGQGLYLAGNVERGFAYRTGVGVNGTAYQLFGRPYTLSFVADRAPLGHTVSLALGHPFFTDLQRTAWHVEFRDVDRFPPFVPPDGDQLSLEVERQFWALGVVRRFGLGRQSAFAGVLLNGEAVTPASRAAIVSDSGLVPDTTAALGGPFPPYRSLRVNAVVGVRALSFTTMRGFDALTAVQDLATGLQLGATVGWGLPQFGNREEDFFVAADLYAGRSSAAGFAALRVEGEARMDPGTNRWDSMVGSGRLAWYYKPAAAHVFVASAEFGGGRRPRVPFQLRLGDSRGGVRGYAGTRLAGAARTVFRLEERWSIGDLTRHAAFGLSGFADAGRVWAGDAPFGTDSRMKVGVGIGLLAAFPPESPRLWRLDVAVPVSADPHAGWEVRLTSTWVRSFWREPDDVARVRADAAASTIFGWP
jgi:hypothetical protein